VCRGVLPNRRLAIPDFLQILPKTAYVPAPSTPTRITTLHRQDDMCWGRSATATSQTVGIANNVAEILLGPRATPTCVAVIRRTFCFCVGLLGGGPPPVHAIIQVGNVHCSKFYYAAWFGDIHQRIHAPWR